jgi:hypothetical protein
LSIAPPPIIMVPTTRVMVAPRVTMAPSWWRVMALLLYTASAQCPRAGSAAKLTSNPTAPVQSRPSSLHGRKLSSKPRALAADESQVGAFMRWLEEGGATLAPGLTVTRRGTVAGLGVVAGGEAAGGTAKTGLGLPKGSLVARIPLSLLINIEHVLTDDVLGPLLNEDGGGGGGGARVHEWLGDVDALAVFLVRERDKAAAARSRFGPWLALLPSEVSSPLTWSGHGDGANSGAGGFITELQASPLVGLIEAARARLTRTHGALLALRGFRGRECPFASCFHSCVLCIRCKHVD